MFVNFSNHPSERWSVKQKEAAKQYGEIIDIPFPTIPAGTTETEIVEMATHNVEQIIQYHPEAVLCQGEMTMTYCIVRLLQERGIKTLAACSERIVEETTMPDGSTQKVSRFRFVRFREYIISEEI